MLESINALKYFYLLFLPMKGHLEFTSGDCTNWDDGLYGGGYVIMCIHSDVDWVTWSAVGN